MIEIFILERKVIFKGGEKGIKKGERKRREEDQKESS